ncbi:putative Syntaxin-22 [Cocos nucifera]|uniref:Putative Syntaxin-22 n=1 Tax=Cocos nucifera TaxID=13894 RepID=A0A8K0IGI1_COCNU|nr:putative Syntaxin-22 [Cocos nucifera]
MSFEELEAGRPLSGRRDLVNGRQDPTQAVAAGVFQINTAVSTFQRLVNTLGTPKDTPELREKLHKTRLHIGQLVKDTSAKLKQASETDHSTEVSASKKIADAKLAKDFQAVLKEFQKAQRLAAERETAYAPFVPQAVLPSSYTASEIDVSADKTLEQRAVLVESRRQEVLLLDNEIVFNEAIIDEREQGIQEIQQQIGEVNEIFKDLAVLVHDQGAMIDDIDSNIENSLAATAQAKTQLAKASKTQRSNSSLLERLLSEMQIQLESLIWENKELEEQLQMAVKDRKVTGALLQEIEEENEKALARIDLLENELQDLKEENMRLNESQGKALWSCKSCDDEDENVHDGLPLGTHHGVPSWSPGYNESGMNPQLDGDSWWAGKEGKPRRQDLFRVCGSCSLPHQVVSSNTMMDESLERQRVVALHRSLFGAMLSLLVGMIIWEAEDPCLPLVAALFTVVGMSLNSVVRFFSTIKNKPASDAVALLSLNWFMLGALAYPTLPIVARTLAPQAIKFADQVVSWLGYSS